MKSLSYKIVSRLALIALMFWCGGFTFYALIVVPIGNEILGSAGQGVITQAVTIRLNYLGLVAAALNILALRGKHTRWSIIAVSLFAITQSMLFALHAFLGTMFNPVTQETTAEFYFWHEVYLTVIAIQWSAAWPVLLKLLQSTSRMSPAAVT